MHVGGICAQFPRRRAGPRRRLMQPLFKWNGQYIGFISDGYVFDADGAYMGWVEDDGSVYGVKGRYMGEVIEQNYVMRNLFKTSRPPKKPISAVLKPQAPIPPLARPPREP